MKNILFYSLVICLLVSCKKEENNPPPANAGIVSGASPLTVGQTVAYTSTGNAGGTWSSSNLAVASVNNSSGSVTALSAGTTTITYTVSVGVFASATLTVVPPAGCTLSMAAVAGNWRITAITYKQTPASAPLDYYNVLYPDACQRDDRFQFNANGTYNFIDAGTVCTPSNSNNGAWSLSGNTMTIDGDPATVDAFSCNSMTISLTNAIVAGDKLTIVFTRI